MLATPDYVETVHPLDCKVVEFSGRDPCENLDHDPVSVAEESPAMILYTSGTTGPPKGVVLTHNNLYHQAQCLIDAWEWTASDRLLHTLPLHHTHGIVNCLLCPLTVGATVKMLPSFNAQQVWTSLCDNEVNLFMAVPTIYAKLIETFNKEQMDRDRIETACKAIRLMVSRSAALPTPVLERWRQITGHTLLERYGMTEIGMALSNPLHGTRTPGAVGSPLPGVKARIVRSKEGEEEVLGEGTHEGVSEQDTEEGDLLIRGPNVFQEYLNKPDATRKEFTEDGWFKTGDTCKIEKGLFRILGRSSVDIIKSGGYKISALDVERVLLSHPGIQDIAVVGVPDPTYGQRVGAVLVLQAGEQLQLQDLRSWCKDKMAKYWIPTELRILVSMPRNTMGKVNKKELVRDVFQ